MTSLGEILLKFGATGVAGEAPLRFQTAHINLLVGPNNAGKSLMLRELSGVNPRRSHRPSRHSERYTETSIVEAVHWDDATAQQIRQEIVAEVFSEDVPAWAELRSNSWDQLLPGLEEAVTRLMAIREELGKALVQHAATCFADLKEFISLLVPDLAQASIGSLVAPLTGLAIILLHLVRAEERSTASTELEPADPASQRRSGPLTPEQAAAVQRTLEAAWTQLEEVLRGLRIDLQGLSLTDLLDKNAFGGALLQELSKNPQIAGLIAKNPEIMASVHPTTEDLERVRRFTAIGQWLLDPLPLENLARKLRESYASQTWAEPSQRAELAKACLYLDGMARLKATDSAGLRPYDEQGDGDQPAILALLRDPESMNLLRELTVDALNAHLVIDITTHTPKAVWRLSQTEPDDSETRYADSTNQFNEAAALLDERSDGIHAFVGMLAAIVAKPIGLVFIDEPEAFLHPPLVRNLARQLSWLATNHGKQIFIATHSADLLESFVAGGAEVNIIRLTHDSERSTARLLNSTDLRHLARDPLLRSESTLSALFHEGAVVCEAAGDRVLYQEINERLLAFTDDGVDSCVFLNAQNWNTIPRMIAPLRRMGVAAAAIVDADVLFDRGLTTVLDAAQVEKEIRDGWLRQRDGLRDKLIKRLGPFAEPAGEDSEENKLQFKGKVIAGLKPAEKKIFANLIASMAKYGVFIVPVGELEDWLSPLGLSPPSKKEKGRWLGEALKRLGQDPDSEGYARPEDGDIWDFVRSINAWILDPEREGTSRTSRHAQ